MIQTLMIGFWVIIVTLAGAYFGLQATSGANTEAGAKAPALELVRLKPVTVPVVSNELVEGYLLATLAYNLEKEKITTPAATLDAVMQDESFRTLYGVEAVKYKKPRKSDLDEISKKLVETMNKRLGEGVVREVLIEELSYIPKESARSGRR